MSDQTNTDATALSIELEAKLLRRLGGEWEMINHTFFKGVLRRPTLQLSDTLARLGQWQSELRTIEISRHLVLDHGWGQVLEVLKHEVAHQFVDECLAVDEPPHGPTFRSICDRLAIPWAPTVSLEERHCDDGRATNTDRLVARIRKLLALAESPNQHEAENAATAAQKLMLRFNIEMDAIEEPKAFVFRHLGKPAGKTFEYQRRVAVILHEHFFVESIWVPVYRPHEGKRGSVLEICGSEPNLAMAEYVHDFLHGTAERLWAAYKQQRGIRSNKDRRSFLAGVMGGFSTKLDAQRAHFREEGLVWVPLSELGGYFRRRHPYVQRVRNAGSRKNAAFSEGRRAGESIVLSQPVTAESSRRPPRALGPGRR
ncbi:MAG: SprT-like domain-containing protein [Deltaproteobacteria bacterium]|nr:SprT-like domain-containing protein [Deltaproteobacteria bacterium]